VSVIIFIAALRLEAKDVSLGTVVVNAQTGQDNYQTGDVLPDDNPSFSSVIKKDAFESRSQTVTEVVEKETAVQIRQSGGLGSFSSISLRGSSSNQVTVLIDGVPLNDGAGGGVDLSNISLNEVEAVEIYKGITPINFKGSIGGAVNIRTRRAADGLRSSLKVGYGSFNTFLINPLVSHKKGKFDYIISEDYLSSRNNFGFTNDNGTKWNLQDDSLEKRNNNQFSQNNFLTTFGYDISKDTRASVSNQVFIKSQGLPAWNNDPGVTTGFSTLRDMLSTRLVINDIGRMHVNSASRLDFSYKKEIYDNRNGGIGLGRQWSRYNTTGTIQMVTVIINFLNFPVCIILSVRFLTYIKRITVPLTF
jgi:outer membrane cobalamin receptor